MDNSNKNSGHMEKVFEYVEMILTALIIMTILTTFFFRSVTVDGPSMEKTLFKGDRVIINSLGYKPTNGDIVVVYPQKYKKALVKRIIAVGGQTLKIDFDSGDVIVDGNVLNEKYINNRTTNEEDGQIPKVIPEGYYFVMGDNRQNSSDSRSAKIGLINEKEIVGKVVWRIFPFSSMGSLYKNA